MMQKKVSSGKFESASHYTTLDLVTAYADAMLVYCGGPEHKLD